jgi:hypothetical protein
MLSRALRRSLLPHSRWHNAWSPGIVSSTAARTPAAPQHRSTMATSDGVDPAARKVLEYWFGEGCVGAPATYASPPELSKKWFMGGAAVDQVRLSTRLALTTCSKSEPPSTPTTAPPPSPACSPQEIREQFGADLESMAAGKYDSWFEQDASAMAGIILMDQFSRWVPAERVCLRAGPHLEAGLSRCLLGVAATLEGVCRATCTAAGESRSAGLHAVLAVALWPEPSGLSPAAAHQARLLLLSTR